MVDSSSSATVELARRLVRVPSVTPVDDGCQQILIDRLQRLGFTVHPLIFGQVHNFYARLGEKGKNFCFAGHTDVTPSGEPGLWQGDPFGAEHREGMILGRGICDMKGALAAMVTAVERFLQEHPGVVERHSLSFLVTGDEEGQAIDGTARVLEWMAARNERLDYCLVGEPTSVHQLGDCLKNGRRGSVNGTIVVHGLQGHVAYPHLARNPIHQCLAVFDVLARHSFDAAVNPHFPPTSFQFTRIQAGDGATNVIPARLTACFNIRFSTEHTPESLEARIRSLLEPLDRDPGRFELTLQVSGLPFLTRGGPLLDAIEEAIHETLDRIPERSTGGGTSDARFISRFCPQTVEFGLVGATMHKVDESTPAGDLETLALVYQRILEKMLLTPSEQGRRTSEEMGNCLVG
ncbi:MAG: succinyl-diaminopimelate desuccinylase [Magnetococcales bacterium]|nr:succinyl-diaminopimelate desuccinylase [Magnetococcales bacterium]